jgi:hypothetical protein
MVLEEESVVIQLSPTSFPEFLIFGPHHRNIQVIVPWNKPTMANSAEHSAHKKAISYPVLLTHPIEF